MNFEFERSGHIGLLTFYGEMTPEREDELKVALMMSFDNADHLVVNLGKVTGVDHSALRLLRTLQQKSSSFKKRLTLIGISTDALKQAT